MSGPTGPIAILELVVPGDQIPMGTNPFGINGWAGGVPWVPPIIPIQAPTAVIVSEPDVLVDPVVMKTGMWDVPITVGDIPQSFTITFDGSSTNYTVAFDLTGFTSAGPATPATADATAGALQTVVSPFPFAKITAIL